MRSAMSDADTAPSPSVRPQNARAPKSVTRDFVEFLIKLIIVVTLIRSLFVATFSIPSESMLPRLMVGDYLLVQKWPYGFSRYSFPFAPRLFDGRMFAQLPTRGDVVVFKAPPGNQVDYIKRVIGLPGDTIQVRAGQVYLNGRAIPKQRIEDFVSPVTPNSPCFGPEFTEAGSDGTTRCRYPRYRETLPGGRSYDVLDVGTTMADDTRVFTVPAGHLFMMGDDRDKSADSRFPAVLGGGIGFVPIENLVGRAWVSVFSTDGSAEWYLPWTWFTAARWHRLGATF
jgi:signal peptidase I